MAAFNPSFTFGTAKPPSSDRESAAPHERQPLLFAADNNDNSSGGENRRQSYGGDGVAENAGEVERNGGVNGGMNGNENSNGYAGQRQGRQNIFGMGFLEPEEQASLPVFGTIHR